jgi:hypothetical protein
VVQAPARVALVPEPAQVVLELAQVRVVPEQVVQALAVLVQAVLVQVLAPTPHVVNLFSEGTPTH